MCATRQVLLGGEADMLMCNAQSGYNYGGYLVSALGQAGLSDSEVEGGAPGPREL